MIRLLLTGIVASLPFTRLMQTFVFGVSPTDPATFLLLSAVLATAVFVASYIPARRAARVDLVGVLRSDSL